jgi:hypothetical protein
MLLQCFTQNLQLLIPSFVHQHLVIWVKNLVQQLHVEMRYVKEKEVRALANAILEAYASIQPDQFQASLIHPPLINSNSNNNSGGTTNSTTLALARHAKKRRQRKKIIHSPTTTTTHKLQKLQ